MPLDLATNMDFTTLWDRHANRHVLERAISDYVPMWTTDTLVFIDTAANHSAAKVSTAEKPDTAATSEAFSPAHFLLSKLDAIGKAAAGERWPGSTWPAEQAFADARLFIESLPLNIIPLPAIGLADDGEINFLWKTNDVHLDLGFYGTGTYSYFAKRQGQRFHGDQVASSQGLPDSIKDLFEVLSATVPPHLDETTSAAPGLSPGVVVNEEELIRGLFNPLHVVDGQLQITAINLKELLQVGFSVDRKRHTNKAQVAARRQEKLVQKNGKWITRVPQN